MSVNNLLKEGDVWSDFSNPKFRHPLRSYRKIVSISEKTGRGNSGRVVTYICCGERGILFMDKPRTILYQNFVSWAHYKILPLEGEDSPALVPAANMDLDSHTQKY